MYGVAFYLIFLIIFVYSIYLKAIAILVFDIDLGTYAYFLPIGIFLGLHFGMDAFNPDWQIYKELSNYELCVLLCTGHFICYSVALLQIELQ